MRIAVLTSSRADFGIYLPLLKKLKKDRFFSFDIIAFGTHLSKRHGYTLNAIRKDGFSVRYKIHTVPRGDSPADISRSMAATGKKFASFWEKNKNKFDLVICLGDRYEMFAAVTAAVPFGIPFAHIHGGETTTGALDNAFRHCLTSFSKLHFTSHKQYARRVSEITGSSKNVYVVGSLSLDNLSSVPLLDKKAFLKKYGIWLSDPVLVTFHPETVNYQSNKFYIKELLKVLDVLKKQLVITMPNADTMGNMIRKELIRFAKNSTHIHLVESFGTQGYFSCMKYCSFILGNSSSGIIEAASFKKYVINIGDRQKGRLAGNNVIHCEINQKAMLKEIKKIAYLPSLNGANLYGNGTASDKIVRTLKKIYGD